MQAQPERTYVPDYSRNHHDYEWVWIRAKRPPEKGIYAVCDPIESPGVSLLEWDGEKWIKFGDPYPFKTTLWSYLIPIDALE